MAEENPLAGLVRGLVSGIKAVTEFLTRMIVEGAKEAEKILEKRWPDPLEVKWQTAGPVRHIEMSSIQEKQQEQQQMGTVARHAHSRRSSSASRPASAPQRPSSMSGARPVARARRLGDRLVTLINDPRASKSGVCPVCEALEGMTFTLEEFNQLVPLHPHCKCKWIPVGRAMDQGIAIDMDEAGEVLMEQVVKRTPEMWDKFLAEWRRGV